MIESEDTVFRAPAWWYLDKDGDKIGPFRTEASVYAALETYWEWEMINGRADENG